MSEAHPEANRLLNEAYSSAQQMLLGAEDFLPFALALRPDGEIQILQGVPESPNETDPPRIIEYTTHVLTQMAERGEARGCALLAHMEVRLAGRTGATPAVRITVEHVEGSAVEFYFPYQRTSDSVEFEEPIARSMDGVVFSGSRVPLCGVRRPLTFRVPPTPKEASRHAEVAVKSARDISRARLDYSPRSLRDVDRIIGEMREDRVTADELAETLFSFGCYVGEVFRRRYGGRWREIGETPLLNVAQVPMVLETSTGRYIDPISATFACLTDGHQLSDFYESNAEGDSSGDTDQPQRPWWKRW